LKIDRRSTAKASRPSRGLPKARDTQAEVRNKGDGKVGDRSQLERTCVGCGKADARSELVRLIVSPEGEVAVDLAGGHFGRGAYLHPTMACASRASKGLSRSLRQQVPVEPAGLAQLIAQASERRIGGLLSSAARCRQLAAGADSVASSLSSGEAALVVVARDAAAAASVGAVARAVADGRAVAFGTKAELGALVGRSEIGVLAITSIPLAKAIRRTALVAGGMQLVRPGADKRTAQASHIATTAEDR
jgi:predicted RNA-binding protein YlxR (DUF448 family)